MKTNKWVKWVVGLGGVTVFTTFLQLVNNSKTDQQQENNSRPITTNEITELQNTVTDETKQQREQQLMSLDWEEGNWDVQYSNEVIIATPKRQNSQLQPSENRTRRS
ncbi:hypothetical protein [Anoxybacillus sp. J5B_2022]|uniref:hypothetical protein n=1 Tax=Anoxybacillus sp. J5B_2022 TaxID=3003246 RepID=UPI0022860432|nr:hypothetical protein [Anoxybacillus sp. J5B_2022]MCZ0757017.1 hypothetical protein [Anoxybacillus sp. J5B_2022]